jgi:hypothetical protein
MRQTVCRERGTSRSEEDSAGILILPIGTSGAFATERGIARAKGQRRYARCPLAPRYFAQLSY